MRATFAVPAVIAHIHCDLMRSLTAEGHELAAHGFRHEDVSGLERDEERRRIARTTEILADVVGRKPAGWFSLPRQGDRYAVGAVSPNTIDLLLEAGYVYLGNGLADDIPHYSVSDFASRRALLTLPYYYHFDDQFFLMFPRKGTGLEHPDALLRNWRGEFAAQYKRGRYFHMTLHPQHIGWSNRLLMLDEFLAELREYPSPVEPDRGGMRALLAGNLPRRHEFTPRTEHLAGLSRQPQLRVPRNAAAGLLPRPSIAARYVIG